jgi:hypothetical protein
MPARQPSPSRIASGPDERATVTSTISAQKKENDEQRKRKDLFRCAAPRVPWLSKGFVESA